MGRHALDARTSGRVVADLEVVFTDPPQLYVELQPREGFDAVRPSIEHASSGVRSVAEPFDMELVVWSVPISTSDGYAVSSV
jgi:hypothetical protein